MMMRGAHFLHLTLLISIAHGIGLDDKKGPLGHEVLKVPEATPVPYTIYQFTSTVEGVSSYHVSGETEGKIAISLDGWLYLEEPLEWSPNKSHHLNVEARSADGKTVDGPYSVALQVVDTNNNAPVFSESQYSGRVREHSPAGVPFLQVSATDADDSNTPNAKLKFSIVNQIPNPAKTLYFGINPDNGEIFITEEGAASLRARPTVMYSRGEARGSPDVLRRKFEDYCTPKDSKPLKDNPFFTCVERAERRQISTGYIEDPDYALNVRVEDMGGGASNSLSSTARVNIVIVQNLWVNPGPITIRENKQGEYPMLLASVRSNDPSARYRLLQKERIFSFPFMINEEGDIYVTSPLDREQKDMYILVVLAEDEQGVELEKPMEIPVQVEDENDNAPVCDEAVFEVQENEPIGNLIGVLPAHDADEENTLNSLLSYTLLSQTPALPADGLFTIDGTNGQIRVAKQQFRRKEVPQYELIFTVSDKVHPKECKAIIKVIDINNEIPIFERNDYGTHSVPELAPLGTTLFTIKATDADDPGTGSSKVEYHITDGDANNRFGIEIDESTGEGSVYIAQPLDYEVQSSFTLQIDARNPEPLIEGVEYDARSTAVVTIQLVDVDEPPKFEVDSINVNVPENLTVGTTIMTATARDPEGKPIKFKMDGDDQGWLELDADSGELKTKAALDREVLEELTLKITAYETEDAKQEAEMNVVIHILDVNDNYPKLKETQGFICVHKMNPLILTAVDNDAEPYGAPFTFSITRKSPNWEIKSVDGTSAQLILKRRPSADQNVSIPINIKDNDGMGITQKFDVRVCNCTSMGYCYIEPGVHSWKLGMSSTIGILAGILGAIVIFMLIAMYRIKKRAKKTAEASAEAKAML